VTKLPPLNPSTSADLLYPADAAFMARSDLQNTRLLGYKPLNVEAVTSLLIGILGTLPSVRHRAGATDEILSFLAEAGLLINEEMHVFETGTEAEAVADTLVAQGKRLFWPYPLRQGRFDGAAHLVAPELWQRLNSKERLSDLVPSAALPTRRAVTNAELAPDVINYPSYLKAAGDEATGWGYAVRYVASDTELMSARAHFNALDINRVIVEEAVDVTVCWCANLSIVDGTVSFLGAAEQTFSAPAKQSGSIIDPAVEFPREGISLAIEIATAAGRLGFRGICGLDIGKARDGRMVVFDPNFRVNASTTQILLHSAAVARSGLEISSSFSGQSVRPMPEIISQIKGPVSDGWFVPTRLLDQAYLPAADGIGLCTGFVMGRSREEAKNRSTELSDLIA